LPSERRNRAARTMVVHSTEQAKNKVLHRCKTLVSAF
jgi:hypothetical protein